MDILIPFPCKYPGYIFKDSAAIVSRTLRCKRTSWYFPRTWTLAFTAELLNVRYAFYLMVQKNIKALSVFDQWSLECNASFRSRPACYTGRRFRAIISLTGDPETRLESNRQRCSIKKAVLKKLTIFTGKHLCWSLFLIKIFSTNKTFPWVSSCFLQTC